MKKRGMKVYFIHSSKSEYNKNLYLPVLRSSYLSNHTLIFSESEENREKYYKDIINDAELLVIELSNPDIGFNMEVKEAIISKKPILALAPKNIGYDPKYQKLFKNVIGYSDENELRYFVETFVKSYEGKLYGGKVDNTVILGVLN